MALKRLKETLFRDTAQVRYPKLRDGLEPYKVHDDKGRLYIGLRDPFELATSHLLIPSDLFYLLRFFDGDHAIDDFYVEYRNEFGSVLDEQRFLKLIKKLDQTFLLHNSRALKKLQQMESEFRQQTIRQPTNAGNSYPDTADALRDTLNSYAQRASLEQHVRQNYRQKRITGMMLPHIDPRLAGAEYAKAHLVLQNAAPVDVFVILGISHRPLQHAFALTLKDFRTPLGVVKTDREFVQGLAQRCDTDFFQDEISHRQEHSVEFQTVFLHHFQQQPFQIVPVLCSFSHHMSEREHQQFNEFTTALATTLSHYKGRVCILASVDLAHVGPHYGDVDSPDSYFLAKVEQFDRRVLRAITDKNLQEFDSQFVRTDNKFNVCGYPAIRTLLQTTPFSNAHLLSYENAIMDQQRSTVTFASIIFSK